MASGENLGREEQSICVGETGLRKTSTDFNEDTGCHDKDDNFLAPLETVKGETYFLFINNYSSTTGFELEFAGTSELSDKKCKIEEITKYNLSIGEVYPNPTQEFLNITLESLQNSDATFIIVDIYGKEIFLKEREIVTRKTTNKS